MTQSTAPDAVLETEEDTQTTTQPWFMKGLCRDRDPDELFVEGQRAQKQARTLCFECPVRIECLAEALDERINFGVWGGMTESERRALLRRYPEVESWQSILQQIQDERDAHRASARMRLVDLWRAKFERENGSSEN